MNIVKSFVNFKEGIEDLLKNAPELKSITGDVLEEAAVVVNMLNIIANDIPSIFNPKFPAVPSFSITAKEVGFKTAGYLAFGWKIEIDDKDVISYSFRLTIVSRNRFAKHTELVDALKENGWKVLPQAAAR